MKKTLLLITALFITILQAKLSPHHYKGLQRNAPESLLISVTKVQTHQFFSNTKGVTVKAKVEMVKRSKSGLKSGDIITIVYNTASSKPKGRVGPSSVPVLKKGELYNAFLKKYGDSDSYEPAARGKSFRYR